MKKTQNFKLIKLISEQEYIVKAEDHIAKLEHFGKDPNEVLNRNLEIIKQFNIEVIKVQEVDLELSTMKASMVWMHKSNLIIPKILIKRFLSEEEEDQYPEYFLWNL